MLKTEQKYRNNRETGTYNKKMFKNKDQHYENYQQMTKRKKNLGQQAYYQALQKKPIYIENRVEHYYEKQNRGMNELSPRHSFQYEKERQYLVDDVDTFSQIRFMSKECSSIKQNNVDIDSNSEALSKNHLQDFSPLFQRIEKNSNDDFILEIEDIVESEPSIEIMYQKCESEREVLKKSLDYYSNSQQSCRMLKSGKIKKNKTIQNTQSRCYKAELSEVDKEIQFVFTSLDVNSKGLLCKNNCKNQNLSTQLNYFIGSILTKIKVKGKQYNFTEFKKEFDILIKDSQPSQLDQIFGSNRLKKKKMLYSLNTEDEEKGNFSFQQNNKQNQLSKRLSRIDEKLGFYLMKNKISSRVTLCSDNTNLCLTCVSDKKYEDNRGFSSKNYQRLHMSNKITQERLLNENHNIYNKSQQIRSQISLRSDSEIVRGIQGGQFQLNFTQLNKHI